MIFRVSTVYSCALSCTHILQSVQRDNTVLQPGKSVRGVHLPVHPTKTGFPRQTFQKKTKMSEITAQMSQFFSSFISSPDANAQCLKWKQKLIQSSPVVRFMMDHLQRNGCAFDPQLHFRCTPCDLSRSGGFSPSHGIILCQNRFLSKQHMEDTLVHELVHAFDHCTTFVNWASCEQLACSGIFCF